MSAPARRAATIPLADRGGERRWMLLDGTAIMILMALTALAFYPVYGNVWLFVTVLGFAAAGIVVALFATKRGWRVGAVTAALVAAWFVVGGPLAMPSSTIGYVLPTGRTFYGLLTGPVTAWRDMLTLDPPIGETFNLLTVPGLAALVAGCLGMLISLRTRLPMLAWVPPAFAYLLGVVLGSQTGFRPVAVGAAFFLVVLAWTSHRRAVVREQLSGTRTRIRPLQGVFAAGTVAVAGLLTLAVVPVVAAAPERTTLRSAVEPPIDTERYASPLQGFRANVTQHESAVLFEVVGARDGDIVRLATLDRYDGISYGVATLSNEAIEGTTFNRVGQWIAYDGEGDDRELSVTIRGYDGVWTPTVGRATRIEFAGPREVELGENFFYNRRSGTGINVAGLREGDSYELSAVVPPRPADSDLARAKAGSVALPASEGVPDEVINLAHAWADTAATAGDAALTIERNLRQGYFSHGGEDEVASLSGHSERRLIQLLSEPAAMVGDGEQYAVAMALMAREMGIPARVIYGYRVETGATITGANVGAWPELYFERFGWVPFDPTPPEDRILEDEDIPQPPQPQPYIENPPPPPQRPVVPPPDEELPIDPGEPPSQETQIDWAQIGAIAAITGIPLLTIVVPIALIVGLKLRRRARRRNHPVLANRFAGAWSELVDRARDVGKSPSAAATRSEQAEALIAEFPKLPAVSDPIGLAKEADWVVFAPGEPSDEAAKAYWRSTSGIGRGMRRSTSALRWAASYLSTKSFRRVR